LFFRCFTLLFFAVTGFLVISNWNINQKRNDLNAKIESLKKKFRMQKKKSRTSGGAIRVKALIYIEKVGQRRS